MIKLDLLEAINLILAVFGIALAVFTMFWSFSVQKSTNTISERTETSLAKIEARSIETQQNIQAVVTKTYDYLFRILCVNMDGSKIAYDIPDELLKERSKHLHDLIIKAIETNPSLIENIHKLTPLYHTQALTAEDYNHLIEIIEKQQQVVK